MTASQKGKISGQTVRAFYENYIAVYKEQGEAEENTVLTLLNNSQATDDKSLQAWAGHKDAAFTRRQYMTPQAEQLYKVSNNFSDYLAAM